MWLARSAVMPSIPSVLVVALVCSLTSAAIAEDIHGRVVDRKTGEPVEGAVVFVSGPGGFERTVSSGKDGSYRVDVGAGRYTVVFLHGKSRITGQVVVDAGGTTKLDGRVDTSGEIITLEHTKAPPVVPLPIDPQVATRAPPYSDKAILADAWTRAWLLLDVDERGTVTRLKFLKEPGYDLEPIAIRLAFKLKFTPGRDADDRPVRTYVLWPYEWVAGSWQKYVGTGLRTGMPEQKPRGQGSRAAYVPCKGDGPWRMISVYKGYRDCSRPDFSKVQTAPWILPGS